MGSEKNIKTTKFVADAILADLFSINNDAVNDLESKKYIQTRIDNVPICKTKGEISR